MRIDGWTLTLQAINFLVLVYLLRRFLYRPVSQAIARRKEATEKALAEAAAAKAGADAERTQLAAARAALPAERAQVLAQLQIEVDAERRKAVDTARAEIEAIHVAARGKLADERATAVTELRRHGIELALELAASILRSSASPVVAEVLVEQLADKLSALPADELKRLRAQLDGSSTVEIVTAPELPASAEEHVRARVIQQLGPAARVAFASDDRLIAGAEIRLPTTIIALSWREALDRARAELERDAAA